MKIIYRTGDVLSYRHPEPGATTNILHVANNRGVMGAGIARQIATKYPLVKNDYLYYYNQLGPDKLLGKVIHTVAQGEGGDSINVITIVAQNNYGYKGKFVDYDYLKMCLAEVNAGYGRGDSRPYIPEIAMPKIGAGLGGGNWTVISKIIESELTIVQPIVYTLY